MTDTNHQTTFPSKEAKNAWISYARATTEFDLPGFSKETIEIIKRFQESDEMDAGGFLKELRSPLRPPAIKEEKFRDLEMREALEFYAARLVMAEILDLCLNPIKGEFDLEHLKKINERVFGPVTEAFMGLDKRIWAKHIKEGEDSPLAGTFREAVEPRYVWMKNRVYPSIPKPIPAYFSRMGKSSLDRIAKELEPEKLTRLGELGMDEFAPKCVRIFHEVDFLHPFHFGNGISSREFARELALACGYELNWHKIKTAEDMMAARDRGAMPLASGHYAHFEDVLKDIRDAETALKFKGLATLDELVESRRLFSESEAGREFRQLLVETNKLSTRLPGKLKAELKNWEEPRLEAIARTPMSMRLATKTQFLKESIDKMRELLAKEKSKS